MQLSRFTDLGLRAMMLLAAAGSTTRVTTRYIAVSVNASEHHVARAVTRLAELECVDVKRGRGGGLFLTDVGRTMSVGALVRVLERDSEVVACAGEHPCPLIVACRLRRALADAQEAFYAELDRHTVTDLGTPALLSLTARSSFP